MLDESFLELLRADKIGGDIVKIAKACATKKSISVFATTAAQRSHITWSLGKPCLFVVKDRERANLAFNSLREYFGDSVGIVTEKDDSFALHATSKSTKRYQSMYKLACGSYKVCVVTADVLTQYLPKLTSVIARVIEIKVDNDYAPTEIVDSLTACGYTRRETLENQGEFTLRGDILSIFPIGGLNPMRISFFGDTVEYIRGFDIDTLENLGDATSIAIYPQHEFSCSQEVITRALHDAKKDCDKLPYGDAKEHLQGVINECSIAIDCGQKDEITEFLLPYIDDKCSIIEYLQDDCVIVFDDVKQVHERMLFHRTEYKNRSSLYIESGQVPSGYKKALIDVETALSETAKFARLGFAKMTSSNPIFLPQEIYNFKSIPMTNYYMNFYSLFSDMRSYNFKGYRIIISCGDEHTAKHVKAQLFDENIYATVCHEIDAKIPGILVTSQTISQGLHYPFAKLLVIGKDELIRKRESVSGQAKKKSVFTVPKCGDYVVHETHGIGMCQGVERMQQSGVAKDYVIIHYAGADKLYVPVDQMDRLSRYSGADVVPKLSKIGGKDFQKAKDSVKSAVKEMAINLVQLYKERQEARGYMYSEDTVWQKEFEDSFEWEETADQLKAVAEIKSDMEKGLVMDRLLCGDVGYGKTEVALRAVFKTVLDGKQAAILAPTAILARQHYNTAMARFNDAKISCALMTRFQTKEENEKARKGVESGKVSVVIGTHRLLSDSIKFQNLGLLVLDEEQRFGVEHKEKMKVPNPLVNVLTLSATPIPRTLNMALTGVRDISVLEMPPVDRLPIETYVVEMTDALLQDAINREIDRDGQVFVLYNRVEDIEKVADRIKRLVPRSKVIIGHGQMQDTQLENAINDFYNKEGNVLVATTIIENGIDLPDANTLIVYDADRLGLSALYQLRGRVGRSNRLAYAYFTTREGKVLTEDASKRLSAIMDYTDFGSGFKIAMRDLEIRGAGNILGKEQHGHIVKVGYDMYCKLLKEAVDEASGVENTEGEICEMDIDINSYLDASYIPNNNEKIKIYKTIAEISSESEKNALIQKLSDSYGPPSENLLNLLEVALIKNLAVAIHAKRVVINQKGAGITFDQSVYKNSKVILGVAEQPNLCVMSATATPTLVFNTKNADISQKMQIVKKFLWNQSKS